MKTKFFYAFVCLLIPVTVMAHDMWLVPTRQTVPAGDLAEITIAVGMDFPASLNAIAADRITLIATDGINSLDDLTIKPDEENNVTKLTFLPKKPGVWIVGCSTRTNRIELEAKKFNDYLLHDGLPQVLAGRLDRDELNRDATEQYSKYTKTLVVAEGENAHAVPQVWRQPLGHKLEIVLLENPLDKTAGETLKAQVLFDGTPLESANLCWDEPGNGEKFSGQTWTNANGEAMVPLAQSGLMTLRLVHMTRPETTDHEWESFWSSFTFSIP